MAFLYSPIISPLYWNAPQYWQDGYPSCLGAQKSSVFFTAYPYGADGLPDVPSSRLWYRERYSRGGERFPPKHVFDIYFYPKRLKNSWPHLPINFFPTSLGCFLWCLSPSLYYCIICQIWKYPLVPGLFPQNDGVPCTVRAKAYGIVWCAPKSSSKVWVLSSLITLSQKQHYCLLQRLVPVLCHWRQRWYYDPFNEKILPVSWEQLKELPWLLLALASNEGKFLLSSD